MMANKKTVLIVEDNADSRDLVATVIKRAGYDVIEAATGLEAIDQAHAVHPDLILMDLGLPGINGDEATARLKADPSTRAIPVIVNTAFDRASDAVARVLASGAAGILYKPTNFSALREMVQSYLPQDSQSKLIPDPGC